jgi:hypothetical protein
LVLAHLHLANHQVREAIDLLSAELLITVFEMLSTGVFFLEVVTRVTKVKIAIDLLVDFACFLVVAYLKELASCLLEASHVGELLSYCQLIKVRGVFDTKQRQSDGHLVTELEGFELVKEGRWEVRVELVNTGRRQNCHLILLHRFDHLLHRAWQNVVVKP